MTCEYRIVVEGNKDYIGRFKYLYLTKRILEEEHKNHPTWNMWIERRRVEYSEWEEYT